MITTAVLIGSRGHDAHGDLQEGMLIHEGQVLQESKTLSNRA